MPLNIEQASHKAAKDTFEALRTHLKNPEFSREIFMQLLRMDHKLIYTLTKEHIENKDKEYDETLRRQWV